MGQIASYMLGGLAAIAAWSMVAPADSDVGPSELFAAFRLREPAAASLSAVNRTSKTDRLVGDRLAGARPSAPRIVTSIEVVGVHNATIIYRDRDGSVLYRTDPVNNVTVVAKGVTLPDITVRHDVGSIPRPLPIEVPAADEQTQMPIGCEPSVSPIASPRLSRMTGRCISEGERLVEIANAAP